jgi:flagellar export protein FliJ
MRPFRFPLQALLTLRQQREQDAQRQYARRLLAVEVVQQNLAATRLEVQHLADEHQIRLRHGAQAHEFRRLDLYRHALNDRLTRLEQDLATARKAAERAWLALVQATQNRQALDQYRQKRRRAYDYALAREEQRLLDDLAARAPTLAGAWRQPAHPPFA